MLGSVVHRSAVFLTFAFFGVFAGCIIIPTPEHTLLEGRGKIEESDLVFLEKGKTTREAVVLRLGEPDLILDHDRILVYHWAVSHGYWFVGAMYTAAGGPIPKNYLFMLEFDDEGLLKRFERTGSVWTSAQAQLDKWAPPGPEKPPSASREIIMIDPAPQAPAAPGLLAASNRPVRVRIGEFHYPSADADPTTLLGHKQAAFGAIVADIRTTRPFPDLVRSAITAQMEAAGHRLVDQNPDITLTGDIAAFGVNTALGLSSWDAVGSLDITVKAYLPGRNLEPLIRHYQARHAFKTVLGPSRDDFEKSVRACLEEWQRQMASDPDLARLFEVAGREHLQTNP